MTDRWTGWLNAWPSLLYFSSENWAPNRTNYVACGCLNGFSQVQGAETQARTQPALTRVPALHTRRMVGGTFSCANRIGCSIPRFKHFFPSLLPTSPRPQSASLLISMKGNPGSQEGGVFQDREGETLLNFFLSFKKGRWIFRLLFSTSAWSVVSRYDP